MEPMELPKNRTISVPNTTHNSALTHNITTHFPIYKVHLLNSEANTKSILLFGGKHINAENANVLFSDIEWQEIADKNISLIYSDFLLYPDDSIGTIKKKIIHAMGANQIAYPEMYLFTCRPETLHLLGLYHFLTEEETKPIQKSTLRQFFYNLRWTEPEIEDAFHKIENDQGMEGMEGMSEGKDTYSLADLQQLFREDQSYLFSIPLGMRFLDKPDYLFSANPFQLFRESDKGGIDSREMTGLLRDKYTLASFENELLLNYPTGQETNLYLCLTEDVLTYVNQLSIDEEAILKTYFPLLYTLHGVRSMEDFQEIRQRLLKENSEMVDEKTLTIIRSVSMLYDIYDKRTQDIPYLEKGIEEIELKIESDLQMTLPLEILFKNIHATATIPFIKYNPGLRHENIYRFYSEQQTSTGKNIPILTEQVIMRLSKEIGKYNEVAMYVLHIDPDTQISYSIYLTIQMNGNVWVKTSMASPISLDKLTKVLKQAVNPIFQEINDNIGQSIFRKLDSLESRYVKIVDMKYVMVLNIEKEIKVNKYAGCITSVFDIMNIDEEYNIYLRFKRVENFKEMNAIQNLIANAFKHVNKNMDDISYVTNELIKNYGMTEEAATNAILKFLTEHKEVRGEIIDNPGFDVYIRNRLDNKVRIEVNHVVAAEYLNVLFIYLDTIIRMSQYPDTTQVPSKEFFALCTKVEKWKKVEKMEKMEKKGGPVIENIIATNPISAKPIAATGKWKDLKPIGWREDSDSESDSEIDSDTESIHRGIFYGEDDEEDMENIEKELVSSPEVMQMASSSPSGRLRPSQIIESKNTPLAFPSDTDLSEKIPTIPKIRRATSSTNVTSSNSSDSRSVGIFYSEEESSKSPESPESPDTLKKGGEESPEEEQVDLEFMKKKIIGKPIRFLDNMKARDPALFVTKKDENYEGYARTCQRKQQPISLSKEEFQKLDPSTYTEAMRYGSDPTKPNYYVCPRYWCLLNNTSMTLEDVKAGKCAKEGKPDNIIPTGETTVPKNAFVYDFTNQGKLNYQYPGFITGKHPDGHCLPCCFIKPNQRKKECHQPEPVADSIKETSAKIPSVEVAEGQSPLESILVKKRGKIGQTVIQADETVAEKEGNIHYIISNETFPIRQKNRFGFLPFSVQLFLQTDNTKAITKDNPAYIRPHTDCFLRYGVEQYKNKSILGSIVTLYAYRQGMKDIPSVQDFLFRILPQAVGLDEFIQYHNGSLLSVFRSKDKKTVETKDVDFAKYEHTLFFKKIDIEKDEQYAFFRETVDSYENFIQYLQDPQSSVDHTYLWDMIVENNPKLIRGGINLVILDIVNNDITDKIEIICPTHSRNRIFDSQKETMFLIKRGIHYEPIVLYNKTEEGVRVKRTFPSHIPFKNIQRTLQIVEKMKNKYCPPLSSMPTVYKFRKNIDAMELYSAILNAQWTVSAQVLNYQGKVIGLLSQPVTDLDARIFVPCLPSSSLPASYSIESIWMDDATRLWTDYRTTVQRLKQIKENSGGKILSQPKMKVLEDHLIVGVLTETNQFVQILPPSENMEPDELPAFSSDEWNAADKTFMTEKKEDAKRVEMIRNIVLENQFYHLFRKFIREHMNLYENRAMKEKISELIENPQLLYRQKLKQMISWLKELMQNKIVFGDLPTELLTDYYELSCSATRCPAEAKADAQTVPSVNTASPSTAPSTSYCIRKEDGVCQLLLPKKHLISEFNNEEVYYSRIADELIRYHRIRLFMMHPQKYLNLSSSSSGEYKISNQEFILLQSVLTPDYFKDMHPYNINSYVKNTNYSTAIPQVTQSYANEMVPLKEQEEASETETEHISRKLAECIKGKIDIVGNTKESMWKRIFPKNAKEIEFKNTTPHCSFAVLIYVFYLKYNKEITVKQIRRILSVKYTELFKKYDKKILDIWKKSGKSRIVQLVKEKKASVDTVIMSEEYYLTDLDIWIFSLAEQLQICIFNRNLLKGLNEKLEWMITNTHYEEAHYFIRSPALKGPNVIPSYHLVVPEYKINELKEFEPIVQNAISGRSAEYRENVQSLTAFL